MLVYYSRFVKVLKVGKFGPCELFELSPDSLVEYLSDNFNVLYFIIIGLIMAVFSSSRWIDETLGYYGEFFNAVGSLRRVFEHAKPCTQRKDRQNIAINSIQKISKAQRLDDKKQLKLGDNQSCSLLRGNQMLHWSTLSTITGYMNQIIKVMYQHSTGVLLHE